MFFNFLFFVALIFLSIVFFFKAKKREAQLVFEDLFFDTSDDFIASKTEAKGFSLKTGRYVIGDELAKAGLISIASREKFYKSQKLIPIFSVLIYSLLAIYLKFPFSLLVASSIAAFCLSYIYTNQRLRNKEQAYIHSLEYALVLVMERLVMAVEAGLDVVSALSTVIKLEVDNNESLENYCPVVQLFTIVISLTESGMQFDKALRVVADSQNCSAIKHAFIHLGNAQRDGGELIMPLRELSDATQSYFQETVEEDIAKTPVKATFPLVLTFVGLIICFLTIPIIQVVETLSGNGFSNSLEVGLE